MHDTTALVESSQIERERKIAIQILIMAIAGFIIVTTEFLIVGFLPPLARDLNIQIDEAGQVVSLFAFTVMIFGPILTAKLSHIDRKKLFTFILLVFVASNALAALSPNIWVLAVARFIPALFLPVFWSTVSETVAQLAGPDKAGRAVSKVYMGVSAALVLGIPLGTLATDTIGWRGSFWSLSALSFLIAALMRWVLPELPPSPETWKRKIQISIFKDLSFIAHVALSVLVFTGMFTAYTYLAETLERLAGIPSNRVGWWLMGFGIVGMFGNYIGGRMVDRNPLGATAFFLLVLGIGMMAAVPLAAKHIWLVIALTIWGVAYTALFPICQVRVMQAGGKAQAFAASMNISAANAGIGLGAILGGSCIRHFGLNYLGVVSTAIAMLALIVSLLMLQKAKAI